MMGDEIEILRMTDLDVHLFQKIIQLSDVVSELDDCVADFVHYGHVIDIWVFDEGCYDTMTICFQDGHLRCAVEFICPKPLGLIPLCERSNFLHEKCVAYRIAGRTMLSKIMTKDFVSKLCEKFAEGPCHRILVQEN